MLFIVRGESVSPRSGPIDYPLPTYKRGKTHDGNLELSHNQITLNQPLDDTTCPIRNLLAF